MSLRRSVRAVLLAQLELEERVRGLVGRARRIEVSELRTLMSNMLRGYESFRASLC